jgi:hypothetical protein
MAGNASPMPPPPAGGPAPKKVSPVVWILGGCAVLVVLFVVALTLGGLFIAHKARQAGLDPELIQKHPELAIVKMAVAANPNAEIVAIDENKGIVTVLDKKTGKTVTMNFEDIKRGKLRFESEGKRVELEGQGQGETGTVTVRTDEGTTKFGAGGVQMPSWLPAYGGASPQGFSSQSAAGSTGGFNFKTAEAPEKVIAFYKDALAKAGLTIDTMQYPGGTLLTGKGGGRTATVHVTVEGSSTAVSGTFQDK